MSENPISHLSDETEISNISISIKTETGGRVVVETKSGMSLLKSTVYIFPEDVFTAGKRIALVKSK